MGTHFREIRNVADVVADAVFIDVLIDLRFTGEFLGDVEGFQDGAGIGPPTADVVDFGDAGRGDVGRDELGDVVGVDVVADLFSLVAEDFVLPAFQVAFDQVGKESVQLDP